MTKEEAIKILYSHAFEEDACTLTVDFEEAVTMAINALNNDSSKKIIEKALTAYCSECMADNGGCQVSDRNTCNFYVNFRKALEE